MLCRYRLYIGSIAARLQCLRTTTPDYTKLANHMPQYYKVSYSISMLISTKGSPIVPYSTTTGIGSRRFATVIKTIEMYSLGMHSVPL